MKKIFTLLFTVLFASSLLAQQEEGLIMQVPEGADAPVIDGVVDDVYATAEATVYNIAKPFGTETPTVGAEGETNWRAVYNADGFYVIVTVADDTWMPFYASTAGGDEWAFDKVEVYFDVNYVLEDGQGPTNGGSGHHQFASYPADASTIDGTPTTNDNGVVWAYNVEDPNYTVEYFIPWSVLVDENDTEVDISQVVGFDVTVSDRDLDEGGARNRAVWSNDGSLGATPGESWNSMDGAGHITFDGADAPIFVDEIILTGGSITEDGQTLQVQAEIFPEDATNKSLKWYLTIPEGSSARASISSTGVITPVMNGVVTVYATSADGFEFSNEVEITISGQVPGLMDLNVIKNGDFNQVNEDGTATLWGGWGGDAASPLPQVIEGVAVATPVEAAEVWQYQFNQNGLQAEADIPYIFKFKTWADADRTFTVDFEDTPANNYNRYGATTDPRSADGRSEWTFDITTEPTWYEFDVVFDQMVESTDQKVQFMLGLAGAVTYIDSVILISEADMALLPTSSNEISQASFKVYPNPAVSQLHIELSAPNAVVAIYNSVGVKMEETNVEGTHHIFDVRNYKKGLYFVRTDSEVVKFVK